MRFKKIPLVRIAFTKYEEGFETDLMQLLVTFIVISIIFFANLKINNIYDGQDKINGAYKQLINDGRPDTERLPGVINACKVYNSYMREAYKCDKLMEWVHDNPMPRYVVDKRFKKLYNDKSDN